MIIVQGGAFRRPLDESPEYFKQATKRAAKEGYAILVSFQQKTFLYVCILNYNASKLHAL